MDVEARLLLYTVVLGAGIGLVQLIRRRAREFLVYEIELAVLLAVSAAALCSREWTRHAAWPAFWAFLGVSILPPALLSMARWAARSRRFDLAWTGASVGGGILGSPVPLRRESAIYGAMAAAERGDEADCRRRLERLVASIGIPAALGGESLVRILPAAVRRSWDEALAAIASAPERAPAILAVEVRAASETGDVVRALRACRDLDAAAPGLVTARWASRRSVLSAAGRIGILTEARDRGLPLLGGPPGTTDLAFGRAHEALGDAATATARYAAALRDARGTVRLDAEAGSRRCAAGTLLAGPTDAGVAADLADLEDACRLARPVADEPSLLGRAPFTVAVSVVTTAASIAALLLLGFDTISLLAAGALSAPLVADEFEWWRLGSAVLLHGGWVHLGMNLGAILFIGIPMEARLGWARTAIVYVGSGLVASLASVYVARTDVGVGASGAAMGLVGALGVLLLRRPALFDPAERGRWLGALGITVLATLAVGLVEIESIDNTAHGAGFLAGAALGWLLLPGSSETRWSVAGRRLAAIGLCGLLAGTMFIAAVRAPSWLGERIESVAGARIDVPRWMRVRDVPGGGAVASHPTLGVAVEFGASPLEPDPSLLVAEDDTEAAALLAAGPVRSAQVASDDGGSDEFADYAEPSGAGFRLRTFRRGGAFALVRIPLGPGGESEDDELALRIGRSLAAVE